MRSVVKPTDSRLGVATAVRVDDEVIVVSLSNGREVTAPVTDYPRLANATPEQRANCYVEDFGTAIRWPEVDEDIGVNSLLGVTEEELYDFAGFTRYS